MLKKIPVSQVRLGMHLHALDGAWMDHPFWKTRFTLSAPDDLRKLQQSAIEAVWIDVAQGLDVAPSLPTPAASPRDVSAAPPPQPTVAAARPAPTSFTDELQRAADVCKRGKAQVVSMFAEARLGQAVNAEACLPLVTEITDSVFRNPGALVSLARLKTQDDYTYMHSVAVCALMVTLGRELGMDDEQCREAGLAGLLHDLGKASVPLTVLSKPGKLTSEEYEIIKAHPRRGHEMLLEGGTAGAAALDVCLHHHERMDGTGYPERLGGEQISVFARMSAICDVYDAVTSNRPYKVGWDPAESIAQMASWKGHFDPAMFKSFVKTLGIYPTGSLVRLQSGKLAVVVEQNPLSLAAPVVKVFFSTNSQMPIAPVRLELAKSNDRIVGRENPKTWGFKQTDELWAGDALLKKG